MKGWIKIYRKITEWQWYDDARMVKTFLHLLIKANIEDEEWMGITIKKGQFITSISKLSKELNLSIRQTRTCVFNLQKTNEITSKSTNKYTVITICNYDNYQQQEKDERQANRQTNDKQTDKQTDKRTDKQTDKQKTKITSCDCDTWEGQEQTSDKQTDKQTNKQIDTYNVF